MNTSKYFEGISTRKNESGEQKHYQLLYDNAKQWPDCITIKEWTPEELKDWKSSGYCKNDGHYTEIGLYGTQEELESAIEKLKQSRGEE